MTVTNTGSWNATWNVFSSQTGVVLNPVNASLNIPITGVTGGNWLVATVGWGTIPEIPTSISVGDDATNWWVPVATSPADPSTDAFALNANWNFATGAASPWTLAAGASFSVQSAVVHVPQFYAAAVVPNGVSATAAITSNRADIHLRASGTVTASAWAYFSQSVTSAFSVAISFYNSGGSLISTVTGTALSAVARTWTQATNTTTAPSGAVTASITVQLTGTPAAANTFYVSEASLYAPVALNYNPFFTNTPALDGWIGTNASLTSSTTVEFNNSPSIQISPSGVGNVTVMAASGHLAPVVAQQFYQASSWLNAPTGYNPVANQIAWYTSSLSLISTSTGTPSPVTSNGWTQISSTAQAPSTAAYAAVGIVIQNSPQTWNTLYLADTTLTSGLGLSSLARCSIWVAPNIASSTTTVAIQPLGQVQGMSATVAEYSGLPAWLTVDAATGVYANGSSSAQLTVTPTQNDFVVATAASNLANVWTLDRVSLSGWAPRFSESSFSFLASSSASFEVASWQTTSNAVTAQFYNVDPLNNNPVFAASVSGWTATNVTATSTTAFAWPNNSVDSRLTSSRSALLTPNGSSASNTFNVTPASTPAAAPGTQYQAEFYVYSPNGWSNYQVQLRWYNSSHAQISSNTSAAFAVPAATWTNNYIVATAPASAAFVGCALLQNGTPPTSATTYAGRGTVTQANDTSGVGVGAAMAAFQLTPATPATINTNWPNLRLEVGFGQESSTPPDEIQWTDISNRLLSVDLQRGRQYELNSLQAGTANFVLRNDDGYLTPGNTQSPYACGVYDPVRLTATWQNKVYGVFVGYMERWPQVWTDPHWGEVNAIALDSWALFAKTLQSMIQEEILLDRPFGYWPCNDGAASPIAANLGTQDAKTPLAITGPPTSSTTTFNGTLGDSSLGYGGTDYVVLPSTLPANPDLGESLAYGGRSIPVSDNLPQAPPLPSIQNGVTVLMFTGLGKFPSGVSSQVSSNISLFTAIGPNNPIIQVWLDTTQNVHVTTWNVTTGASTDHGSIAGPWDSLRIPDAGIADDLHFALEWNTTGFTLYTNSAFNGSTTLMGTDTMASTWNQFEVVGRTDQFNPSGLQEFGYIAVNNIALYDRFLPTARLQTIFNGRNGAGGDYGDVRVDRFLSYQQPVPARVYYDVRSTQTELIGSLGQAGQNIGSAINDVVTSEAAFNYIDRNGYFVYRARQNAPDRGIQAVFGENTAAGELPYLVSIEIDYDPSQVFNDVQVTYVGTPPLGSTSPPNTLVTFQNDASIAQYGDRSLSVNQLVSDFTQVANLGNYLLNQYKQPALRVTQVELTPSGRPSMFSQLLALDIGDRVTLNRRPVGAPALSLNVMIIGVSHTVDYSSGEWTTRYDIMPESIAALQTITFTVDTTTLDLLDDGNVIGWG